MRLKDKEISNLIKEHGIFHEKYIESNCIVSFNDPDGSYSMCLSEFIKRDKAIIYPDREEFFKTIAHKKQNLINKKVLEIGVADGNNALRIYKYLNPSKIFLIDPWVRQKKRAADRRASDAVHKKAYQKTKSKFSDKNCEIIKNYAENVVDNFEDEFFDFIYIDGDHSYEGCKKDLDLYYPKLKKGGFFGGHDFTGNLNSFVNKKYGVQKAVCEFLISHNKKLQFITLCHETKAPDKILPFDWGFVK